MMNITQITYEFHKNYHYGRSMASIWVLNGVNDEFKNVFLTKNDLYFENIYIYLHRKDYSNFHLMSTPQPTVCK